MVFNEFAYKKRANPGSPNPNTSHQESSGLAGAGSRQHSELLRGHHPAEQARAPRGDAGDFDRTDGTAPEIEVEMTIPGEKR